MVNIPLFEKFYTSQVVSRISSINSMSESLIKIQPVPVDPPKKKTSPGLVAIQALLLEILMLAAHHPERRCF